VNSTDKYAVRAVLDIPNDAVIAVMVGRLAPKKGVEKFIDIIRESWQTTPRGLIGLIIGDGELMDNLVKYAGSLVANKKVIFLGYRKDVLKYLCASDIFLFPSEGEVLPISLIEASAIGLPIVCSDIPGNNDIVKSGFNGILVDPVKGDYLKKITKLLEDREFAGKMTENGICLAKKEFDRKKVIGKIRSLYVRITAT